MDNREVAAVAASGQLVIGSQGTGAGPATDRPVLETGSCVLLMGYPGGAYKHMGSGQVATTNGVPLGRARRQ